MDESHATPTLTQAVAISVLLSDRLTLLQSDLANAGPGYAGDWSGTMMPGDVMTFTLVASLDPGMAPGEVATATLRATLEFFWPMAT